MKTRWYKDAVVYQIYPRSFCDSNGDGIGDIQGIISKLDYLKDLGVNAVWLSPVYKSPNDDNGYDISDYRDIMTDFGTLADWKEMLDGLHSRGMKLIMDLVANHTSDEHYWFTESRKSVDNPYRNYYIWKKGKGRKGKKPPNNWTSRFTGTAWTYDETTKEWYLHLFSKKQPDLNWDNPKVRQEIANICNYWFELGVDGFRCDVITYISKTDYENGKRHIALRGDEHFILGENIDAYLKEIAAKSWNKYDSLIVGEAPGVDRNKVKSIVREGNNELDSVISFEHTYADALPFGLNMKKFKYALSMWQQLPADCWNTLYYENHDGGRSVTRYANGKKDKNQIELAKMLAVSLHFLRGTAYVYQGEELGMTNCPLKSNEYRDIMSVNILNLTKHMPIINKIAKKTLDRLGRDHARTPMQWNNSNEFAGFSDSAAWMKVNPNYTDINAESELADPNSVLNFYKNLIKFKLHNEIIINGSYREYYPDSKYLFVYERELGNTSYFVACNFKNKKVEFLIPNRVPFVSAKVVMSNYGKEGKKAEESYQLEPYEAIVFELIKPEQKHTPLAESKRKKNRKISNDEFNSFLQDNKPAKKWVDCYPIGNGNLGVMDYQNPSDCLMQLNDDTFWSGYGKSKHNTKGAAAIQKIRELTLEGKKSEAEKMILDNVLGGWTENYLPVGDLRLTTNINKFSEYSRTLDMNNATLSSGFFYNDKVAKIESFVSFPNSIFIKRVTSDGELTSKLSFTIPKDLKGSVTATDNGLNIEVLAPSRADPIYHSSDEPVVFDDEHKGISLSAIVKVITNGQVKTDGDAISIEGYTALTIMYTSKTSFKFNGNREKYCEKIIKNAETLGFDKLRADHIADYQSLYGRMFLTVNGNENSPVNTEKALKKFKRSPDDSLILTLFDFGRYLTISSSRQGTQATNLQGIWNNLVRAPWSSNYTTNINTEMNYFGTDLVNLSECVEPLFAHIKKCYESGKLTAKETFGMNGWVLAHNSDVWGQTNPVGGEAGTADACTFGLFVGGSGWILHHLFEHFQFTGDTKMLAELLPYIEGATEFYLDYLSADNDGKLVPNPSASPENRYVENGKTFAISTASTMETSIIRTTFITYLKAAKILGVTAKNEELIEKTVANMRDYVINENGLINEWDKNYRETDPRHRHVSHLYGLYPQYEITPEKTPELANAAAQTLKRRGMGGTGWSLAWKINMYARLKDGEKAYRLIRNQLRYIPSSDKVVMRGGGSYSSLLCAHPPFQIDGNFGVMSGIAEMLLQSHGDAIELLPALPSAWKNGAVRGLKARGNYTVNITWDKGMVTNFAVISENGEKVKVKVNGEIKEVETKKSV